METVAVKGKVDEEDNKLLETAEIQELANLKEIATPPVAAEANYSVKDILSTKQQENEIEKMQEQVKELPNERFKGTIKQAKKQATKKKVDFPVNVIEEHTRRVEDKLANLQKWLEQTFQNSVQIQAPVQIPNAGSLSEPPVLRSIGKPLNETTQNVVVPAIAVPSKVGTIQQHAMKGSDYGFGSEILEELRNINNALKRRPEPKDMPFDPAVTINEKGQVKKRIRKEHIPEKDDDYVYF